MCAFHRRLGICSWIVPYCLSIFIDASLSSLRRASDGHFCWEVFHPRFDPAALGGGGQRQSGGGEAAPRGESLGDCERQRWPGASTGRCDGPLMAFAYLFYHIILHYNTLHIYLSLYGDLLYIYFMFVHKNAS